MELQNYFIQACFDVKKEILVSHLTTRTYIAVYIFLVSLELLINLSF